MGATSAATEHAAATCQQCFARTRLKLAAWLMHVVNATSRSHVRMTEPEVDGRDNAAEVRNRDLRAIMHALTVFAVLVGLALIVFWLPR